MSSTFPFPVLVGDIGGTNARFALLADREGALDHIAAVETASFPSLEAAIREAILPKAAAPPRSAIIALAAPIRGDSIRLTNARWIIDPRRLIAEIELEQVGLLNDFEALSLSLPSLRPADYVSLGGGDPAPARPKLVVGPGTGLGAGALLPLDGGAWLPVPGEGGHLDLGPRTERDAAIWPHLERIGGRVSAEAVLSGPGLARLYRAITLADGGREEPHATPAAITATGLAGRDPVAVETLALFATYLGRYAADLALVFLPRGGVYLAGGISLRLATFLKTSGFHEAFVDKAPHHGLMERFPTVVVTHPNPAVEGLAAFVREPGRFALDLTGRVWG